MCWICGGQPEHVHHRTYKNLGAERIAIDLVALCELCHSEVHRHQRFTGRSVWQATRDVKNRWKQKRLRR